MTRRKIDKLPAPVVRELTKYEKFCKLRDEMNPPGSLGGTYYPKYSEQQAFDLAVNFLVDDDK
jgi:hypothetical protein